jgi:hypothetical protein
MRRPLVAVAAAALFASMVLLLPGSRAVRPAHGLSYRKLNKIQRRILSGFATSELNPAATTAAVRPRSARRARPGTPGYPPRLCVTPAPNALTTTTRGSIRPRSGSPATDRDYRASTGSRPVRVIRMAVSGKYSCRAT